MILLGNIGKDEPNLFTNLKNAKSENAVYAALGGGFISLGNVTFFAASEKKS